MGDKNDIIPHTIPLGAFDHVPEYTLFGKPHPIELVNEVIAELNNEKISNMKAEITMLRKQLDEKKEPQLVDDYYDITRKPSDTEKSYERSEPLPGRLRSTRQREPDAPTYHQIPLPPPPPPMYYHMYHMYPMYQQMRPVILMNPMQMSPMQVQNAKSSRFTPYSAKVKSTRIGNKMKLCTLPNSFNHQCAFAHSINEIKLCQYGDKCICIDCDANLHSEAERVTMHERCKLLEECMCLNFQIYGSCGFGNKCSRIHWIRRIGVINEIEK